MVNCSYLRRASILWGYGSPLWTSKKFTFSLLGHCAILSFVTVQSWAKSDFQFKVYYAPLRICSMQGRRGGTLTCVGVCTVVGENAASNISRCCCQCLSQLSSNNTIHCVLIMAASLSALVTLLPLVMGQHPYYFDEHRPQHQLSKRVAHGPHKCNQKGSANRLHEQGHH